MKVQIQLEAELEPEDLAFLLSSGQWSVTHEDEIITAYIPRPHEATVDRLLEQDILRPQDGGSWLEVTEKGQAIRKKCLLGATG